MIKKLKKVNPLWEEDLTVQALNEDYKLFLQEAFQDYNHAQSKAFYSKLKKGTKIANKTSILNTHNPKISGKYCDALANK